MSVCCLVKNIITYVQREKHWFIIILLSGMVSFYFHLSPVFAAVKGTIEIVFIKLSLTSKFQLVEAQDFLSRQQMIVFFEFSAEVVVLRLHWANHWQSLQLGWELGLQAWGHSSQSEKDGWAPAGFEWGNSCFCTAVPLYWWKERHHLKRQASCWPKRYVKPSTHSLISTPWVLCLLPTLMIREDRKKTKTKNSLHYFTMVPFTTNRTEEELWSYKDLWRVGVNGSILSYLSCLFFPSGCKLWKEMEMIMAASMLTWILHWSILGVCNF